jgi:hypothetical protein
MKFSLLLFLLAGLIGASPSLQARDYTVIEQLPQKVTAAQKASKKGWDSGVTPQMKEASSRYNKALAGLIKLLRRTYYAKEGTLSDETIDAYLEGLYAIHLFKQEADNPEGEWLGTEAGLDLLSEVSNELESTIDNMVRRITESDPKFNYKAWKARWLKVSAPADSAK